MDLKCVIISAILVSVTSTVTDEQYASMPDLFHIDDFDNCMLLKNKSLYCFVSFQLTPRDNKNVPEIWHIIQQVNSSRFTYRHDLIRHIVCVPKTCPNVKTYNTSEPEFLEEIEECFNGKFKGFDLKGEVKEVKCRSAAPLFRIDMVDYIVATVVGSYVILIITISFYDLYKWYLPEDHYENFKTTRVGQWITAFSIPSNWVKLKTVPSNEDFKRLKSVQGIRVYTTILVITVHTSASIAATFVSNPRWIEKVSERPGFVEELPKRGIYMLSFYFMMSTWMMMNYVLSKNDRKEEIDTKFIIMVVIKRYLRLMPTWAVIIAFNATWLRHLPFGMYGIATYEESGRCRENWWTNILLINNFVNRYRMCHLVTWYLAVETQYYIISLILIKLLVKNQNQIKYFLPLLLGFNMLFTFLDHYRHGYSTILDGNPENFYRLEYTRKPELHNHFFSYHANFAGSIIGLWYGYLYHKYKNQQLFESKVSRILWWAVSLGLLGSVLIVPVYINVDKTPFHSAVWVALTRPIFAAGMGLLVLGLSHGLGGVLKWTFEWAPLQILAKLTFCAYVIHTVFQNIRTGCMRSLTFVNYYVIITTTLSDVFISFLVAVPLTLLFEMPLSEIANRLFKTSKTREKSQ